MEKKNVFISYKSEEWKEAELIKSALEDKGISCWIAPRDIPGGSNYAKEIVQAINNCRIAVLVLSARAQKSIWIPKEIERAINLQKIVMPFVIEDSPLEDEFSFYLSNVQMYCAYRDKSSELKRMTDDIVRIIGKEKINENKSEQHSLKNVAAEKKQFGSRHTDNDSADDVNWDKLERSIERARTAVKQAETEGCESNHAGTKKMYHGQKYPSSKQKILKSADPLGLLSGASTLGLLSGLLSFLDDEESDE